MKKITVASIFLAMSTFLVADENTEKKTNKEELQKTTTPPPSRINSEKSGFFLGGGIGLGGSEMGRIAIEESGSSIDIGVLPNQFYNAGYFTFDLNAIGGYQWYFDSKQKQGLRGIVQLGFSSRTGLGKDGLVGGKSIGRTQNTDFLGLNIAISADYIYDFLEMNNGQTLGASVGLGYKYNAGFLSDLHLSTATKQETETLFNQLKGNRIAYHSITPRIGIHYYMGKHQFEFLTSIEPVIGGKNNFKVSDNGASPYMVYQNKIFYNFNLNYTYRF